MGSHIDYSQISQFGIESLESLSSTIAIKSAQITKLLAARSLPVPTFREQSYADFAHDDSGLREARNELISAAQDILRLAQGPEDHILDMAWSVRKSKFPYPSRGRASWQCQES